VSLDQSLQAPGAAVLGVLRQNLNEALRIGRRHDLQAFAGSGERKLHVVA
jgi:hypothetical protein